jgi:hypothetical protein
LQRNARIDQAPLSFDVGSSPVSAAVGDFNRDGIADLVVANNGSDNVSVLLGKLTVRSTRLSTTPPAPVRTRWWWRI